MLARVALICLARQKLQQKQPFGESAVALGSARRARPGFNHVPAVSDLACSTVEQQFSGAIFPVYLHYQIPQVYLNMISIFKLGPTYYALRGSYELLNDSGNP